MFILYVLLNVSANGERIYGILNGLTFYWNPHFRFILSFNCNLTVLPSLIVPFIVVSPADKDLLDERFPLYSGSIYNSSKSLSRLDCWFNWYFYSFNVYFLLSDCIVLEALLINATCLRLTEKALPKCLIGVKDYLLSSHTLIEAGFWNVLCKSFCLKLGATRLIAWESKYF